MDYLRCLGSKIGDWRHAEGKLNQFELCDGCFATFKKAEEKQITTWEMFAQLCPNGKFNSFYGAPILVSLCGAKKVVKVKLTLDSQGSYWGWLFSNHPYNHDPQRLAFIYLSPVLVEVCLAHGSRNEIKRGRGKMVQLKVEVIP